MRYSKEITEQVKPEDLERLREDDEKADMFTVCDENPCECCLYIDLEPSDVNCPCKYCERYE